MKRSTLFLFLYKTLIIFSQTKTYYDCSFATKTKTGANYTISTKINKLYKIDYFNALNRLIKTEHSKKEDVEVLEDLEGLQIIYNYNGSIFSTGNFKSGEPDSIWKTNFRNGDQLYETYDSGIQLQSVRLDSKSDTLVTTEFRTDKKNYKLKSEFYENNIRKRTIWYNYNEEDSIIYFFSKGKIHKIEYRDSINIKSEIPDSMPCFKGGNEGFTNYMENNFSYPQTVINDNICEIISVVFTVDEKGNIDDIIIEESEPSKHPDLEKTATNLIKNSSGKWIPGKRNGKYIKVKCTIPIEFLLN